MLPTSKVVRPTQAALQQTKRRNQVTTARNDTALQCWIIHRTKSFTLPYQRLRIIELEANLEVLR